LELLGVFSGKDLYYTYPNGDMVSNVDIAYLCEEFTGNLITQTNETTDIQWFKLDELPENISPPVKPVLKRCLEVLINRQDITNTLFELEMDFMRYDFCRDAERLASRISDDFVEFGQSGRCSSKRDVVDVLSKITEDRKIELSDFCVRRLADDSYLATYRAAEANGRISNHSSVWVSSNSKWKIVFHQGTTIPID
jgi:hypothetical protein